MRHRQPHSPRSQTRWPGSKAGPLPCTCRRWRPRSHCPAVRPTPRWQQGVCNGSQAWSPARGPVFALVLSPGASDPHAISAARSSWVRSGRAPAEASAAPAHQGSAAASPGAVPLSARRWGWEVLGRPGCSWRWQGAAQSSTAGPSCACAAPEAGRRRRELFLEACWLAWRAAGGHEFSSPVWFPPTKPAPVAHLLTCSWVLPLAGAVQGFSWTAGHHDFVLGRVLEATQAGRPCGRACRQVPQHSAFSCVSIPVLLGWARKGSKHCLGVGSLELVLFAGKLLRGR